ncbi:putative Ig domain-containing protein, partial [Neptunomonas sp.]|uniref:putative Ig domain-containing protein n=1 Tax=Neptunomonas sp. TaxID=1971898 RepID=UPI003565E3A0
MQTVNDEPTLTATGSDPTFTEGGAAASLFSGASADTIESGQTLSALTLTVTNVNDGASEILNADGSAIGLTNGNSGTTATNSLSYSVSVTGSTATLTLSGGTLSEAATQTLIDAISYQNNSNDPNSSDRVVTITSLQDNGGTANGGDDTATLSIASTVTMQTVNDEPTLTATGSDPTFTEGGAAVSLFSGTSVDPIESGQNVIEMWISVGGEADDADEVINFDGRSIALQNSNSGSTDNFSGFLVYTSGGDKFIYLTTGVGSVTPTVLEGLIDNMSYQNNSSNPTEGTRTITIRGLTDDGGIANGGDDFNAALSVSSEVAVIAANTAPSLSSNNFVLSEGVTTTITPAMLAATDADDANAGLTFTMSGISGGQFALSGNPAVAITSFTQSQITSGVVVFVDNGDETAPAFSLSVSDGVNSTVAVLATINFSNVNDAPTLSATASNPTFTEGGSPVSLFSGSSADPIEASQRFISFTVTVSNVLDASEETLSLDGEDIELTHGESDDTDNFNYTVSVTGNTATLSFSGGSVTATQLESLINGMRYENDSESPSTGNRVITITELQDNGGIANSGDDTATLSIASTVSVGTSNDDPTLNNAISDQNATEDSFFSFTFAAGTFGDVDAGDTLSYSAALPGGVALPAWLTFDDATRTFSGTPLNANVGSISVTVSADDGNGGTPATDTFDIVVANSNDVPTVANLIPDQNVTEDSFFSFQFAANTFTDMDGDTLIYSATLSGGVALPAWLTFDDATRTFSGTPLNADVGTTTVIVTANDSNGGSVIDRFDIVIINSNDAPSGSVTINTDGTPAENETLSVSNAITDDDGLGAITYHWQRNGSDIGSTGSNYTLVDADVGQTITVEARYTDASGTNEAVLSNSISGITNVNDAPSGAVLISGIFAENETLTASNTLADEDGLGTITYHWQRDGSDIGSTGSSYLLTDADMGKKITVEARYTDLTGVAERVSSSPVMATVIVDDIESGSSAPLAEKVLVPAEVKEIENKVAEEKAPPVTIKVEADNPPEVVASTAVKFVAPPELPSFEPNEINSNNIKPLALAIGNQTSVMTDLKVSWLQLSDPLIMVNSSGLMQGLDQMEKEFQQRIGLDQMVVGSSIAMSTSLSVGYVAWLLRSGVLLSSVLTSLPAWRFIDPLPILSTLGSEEGGLDVYASGEESLEELVQKDNTDETSDTRDL